MERVNELLKNLMEKANIDDADLLVDSVTEIRKSIEQAKKDIGLPRTPKSIDSVTAMRKILNNKGINPPNYHMMHNVLKTPIVNIVAELKALLGDDAAKSMYDALKVAVEGKEADFDYYGIINHINELLQVIDIMIQKGVDKI